MRWTGPTSAATKPPTTAAPSSSKTCHETLREWCIKFSALFVEGLRHRAQRRGSQWPPDEGCVKVGGANNWLWRAVDEHGFVLDILQRHPDTDAAKTLLTLVLGEDDVPEVIHTGGLCRDGAATRVRPSLVHVAHQQVLSTARCHHVLEQDHRATRQRERSRQGFRRRKCA
ncbi:DDE-type integrase/transposase/recombinase [Deinococcus humi]|uniref:DDE-type integrase/transposase/recombinase n=1 Tax=Deinococcus humi TaxID=662880 RepID=UPI00161BD9C0